MRRASHFHRWPGRHTGLWRLALLGFCFCGGILLGQLAARSVPEASRTELAAYLRQYAAVWGEPTDRTASLLRVAGVYLRYPLLAFLFGLSAAGVALIPLLCAAQGFFLSFSVCCFAAALGRDGVLLALAALGLRCLFVLPCTLCLADAGFAQACRAMPRLRPRRLELNWRMLLFCVFVLLTGTVVECAIVPKFFALILARIA